MARRYTQPQHGPAQIDWSNPLTKDLVFAFEASVGQRDLVTGAGQPLGSGVTSAVGKFGKQYNFSGSQGNQSCSFGVHKGMLGATQATWDILIYFNAANPSTHFFGQWDYANEWLLQANSGALVWVAADDNTGKRARFDSASNLFPSAGWYRLICSWRSNAAGGQTILLNGAVAANTLINTAATAIGTDMVPNDYLQIGTVNGGSPLNGSVAFARAWRRGMSLEEMKALNDAPWQIFRDTSPRLFIASAGGGTTSVSADSSPSYVVRSAASADNAVAFNVLGNASSDASSSYAVRTSATADSPAAYSLRSAVQADDAEAFKVRASVAADDAEAFVVRASVQSSDAETYKVRGAVSADALASYDILSAASVATSNTASFVVRGSVLSDNSPAYAIRSATLSDCAASYAIRALVSRDVISVYDIEASISAVYADLTADYSVNGIVAPYPTAAEIAAAVRSELAVELDRLTKLAALSAIDATLVVTPTSRTAGTVSQTIVTAGDTTTVQ